MKVSRRHGTEAAKVVPSGLYRSLHEFQLNCNTPRVLVLFLAQQETCSILKYLPQRKRNGGLSKFVSVLNFTLALSAW